MNKLNVDASGNDPGASSANIKNQCLILGVGNVMMGDEGLGVHVARKLLERYIFPPGVEVVDGGTGGLALLPLIQSAERVVIVDAIKTDAEAGSIFMFDAEEMQDVEQPKFSLHDTGIIDVIKTAALVGATPPTIIIGVQVASMDEFGAALSDIVKSKIDRVIELVLEQLQSGGMEPHPKGVCSFTGKNV